MFWYLEGTHVNHGRVILVHPPDTPDRFTLGRRKGRLWETNLGLIALATSLEQSGWVFAPAKQAEESALVSMVDSQTSVGVSVLPSNYLTGLRYAKTAKVQGSKRVIMGGPYANSRRRQIISNHWEVDVVVEGAGEKVLPPLLQGNDPLCLSGVTARNSNGEVVSTPRERYPLHDRPIPRRELWPGPLDQKLGDRSCSIVYWEDGCPIAFKEPCVFCSIDHPDRLSKRTPEQVTQEMTQLNQLGFRAVEDGGDDFPSGGSRTVKWLNEVADRMEAEGLDFHWLVHATSRALAYPAMLPALHRAGVRIAQIGFESGDPALKIAMKTSVGMESTVLSQMQDLGMKVYGTWVMGMPGEGERSVEMTISQITELYERGLLCGVLLDPLWPGPGSPAFEKLATFYPEMHVLDYIPADLLLERWFLHFSKISLERVYTMREEVLARLEVPIVGGMLL